MHDARLEARAIREGWKLDPAERAEIIEDCLAALRPNKDGKRYRIRHRLIAAKTLIAADLHQQEIELKRQEPVLTLNDALDEALDDRPAGEAEEGAGEVSG